MICQASVIPNGPEFRIGRLDNGLTYYLCHNETPKGCADFFIAHNVGALQEEDSQNGLAHFLEHMAFNGTEHYPDKRILEFLAGEGVRFGYNVNAYTNRTETVYNVSKVPLVRESFRDSVLMVLRDWSCAISCEQGALDDERGVIHEEWRNRDGQRYRMATRQTALLYKGGKHPQRTVLGDMDVVLNFRREDILDFYHRWYRPDLQAIIVIGDYDVDEMESAVLRIFSDIPVAAVREQKGNYAPDALTEPLYEDMTDPQLRYTVFKLFSKQPYPCGDQRNTEEFFKDLFSRQIITSVIGDRLERCCQSADSPAKSAVAVFGDEGPYFYMTQFTLAPKQKTDLAACLQMTCTEIERMVRHGISREEFEQARFSVMKHSRLNDGDPVADPDNTELAKTCVEHFLRHYPCLNPTDLRDVKRDIFLNLAYEDVAPYASSMFDRNNTVYSNSYNDSDAEYAPSLEQMKAVVAAAQAVDPGAKYLEYDVMDLNVDAVPGRIVKSTAAKEKNYVCWKLSNGAKVWWTAVPPVKTGTHLSLEYRYDTGLNAFDDDQVAAARFATAFMSRHCGFAGQDRPTLMNGPAMAGVTYFTNTLKGRYAALSINSAAGKAEDAFKLGYLKLTDSYPGKEANLRRARFDALQSLAKERNASDIYSSDCDVLRYGKHPWLSERDSAAVEAVDMAFLQDALLRLYGDPGRLNLFISSDLPEESIREYVEKYVASLPVLRRYDAKPRHEVMAPLLKPDVDLERRAARRASPYTEVNYSWISKTGDDTRLMACSDILDYIMSARCLARIREERGGTYHVSFDSELYLMGRRSVMESSVRFRTREELKEVLLSDVKELMDDMCANGPDAVEMETAVKYLVKHDAERRERRAGSVSMQNDAMMDYVRHGIKEYDYASLVSGISAKEVQALARRIRAGRKMVTVYVEE